MRRPSGWHAQGPPQGVVRHARFEFNHAPRGLGRATRIRNFMRIAGIDYGTVRIGIATADLEVGIAGPYETYARRSDRLDAEYFKRLATEERIGRFVVGLPVHISGHESQKSTEARTFGAWLEKLTGVPVEYFDERYTSAEAESMLLEAGLTKKQRKERLDQLAAQIMLTAYLEAGARGQDSPDSLD